MEKLFTIQPDEHHGIYTGKSADGTQIFVTDGSVPRGWTEDKFRRDFIVTVFFDTDGSKIRVLEKSYQPAAPVSQPELYALADTALQAVLQELALTNFEPITVKKFFVPGYCIGISQYTSSDQRFLDKPEWTPEETAQFLPSMLHRSFHDALATYSERENSDDRAMFETWKKRGDYVLYSGNDFWCFSNGKIHSS